MKVSLAMLSLVCVLLLAAALPARAQKPELVTQAGHADGVVSTVFNPDGGLCATGDASGIVKLWDARTGRLLRTINAHRGRVSALAFSADGRSLASESKPGTSNATNYADSTLKLWDVRTGGLLLNAGLGPFAFSPAAGVLAVGDGKAIKLWDARDGRPLRTLEGHALPVVALSFSPDGKLIGSTGEADEEDPAFEVSSAPAGSEKKTETAPPPEERARLWDVESGKLLSELQGCKETLFSPDGSLVADAAGNLCETKTGRLLRGLGGDFLAFSPDGATVIFREAAKASGDGPPPDAYKFPATFVVADVRGGTIRLRIAGYLGPFTRVAGFGPGGRTLIISGTLAGEKEVLKIEAWDMKNWSKLYEREGYAVDAVSPDAKHYTAWRSVGEDKSETGLYEAQSGKPLGVVALRGGYNEAGVFSPDGRTLALTDVESVALYDVPGGGLRYDFRGSAERAPALAFSPDGKAFALTRGDSDVSRQRYELWDTRSGSPTGNVKSQIAVEDTLANDWQSLGFTPDSSMLVTADGQLRDARTGATVRDFKSAVATAAGVYAVAATSGVEMRDAVTNKLLRRIAAPNVSHIALSPEGNLLAVGFGFGDVGSRLNLYDAATGRLVRRLEEVDDLTNALAFSRDGRLLAVTYGSGSGGFVTNAVYEAGTGRRTTTFFDASEPDAASENTKRFLAFSPDGRLAVLQGRVADTVEFRDTATGKLVKTIGSVTPYAESAAFSPDGKILATGDGDTGVRFWSVGRGELLGTLLSFEGGDWLAVSPDGIFDGSPAAWGRMLWRFSADTFDVAPAEIFFNEFYRPGLLGEIFAGERPRASQSIADKDRRQPRVAVELAGGQIAPGAPVEARTVALRLTVAEASPDAAHAGGGGARDLRLFRNGSLVKAWRGDVLEGKSGATLEAAVPIVAGENRFTAYAFNRDNVKSIDSTLIVKGADSLKRKGTAYVLAIGVNEYMNAQYNLRYAVADAQVFSDEWRRQQETLRGYERVETVLLFDHEATKANMLAALARLAEKTQPEDAVVVYFAGHGTAYREQFYLLPHDLGYAGARERVDKAAIELILAHSVSDRELEGAFEKINAAQILFVIDACNSGQALEAEEKRRGPMNSKGLAQLAYEKGMYILTAAQSFEAAQETAQLGHGLLTYALVEEGLKKSSADAEPKDGEVRVREWLDYATRRVPEMQIAEMKRALARGIKLSFADEERSLNIANRSGQRPRVFYRRELESQPLVVARPAATAPAGDKPKTPPAQRPAPAKASPKPRVKKR